MNKKTPNILLGTAFFFLVSGGVQAQMAAVFNYTVEIDLTNDQGDMPTKEYLKNYGTKGKKRSVEYIYSTVNPFLVKEFQKSGIGLLPLDTLSPVKHNEYGFPAATLAKAVPTGITGQYIRIHIKDISQVSMDGGNRTDPLQREKKIVKMRCRIQVFNPEKELIKDAEGTFQTGEKIENPAELGIDLRSAQGSEYQQELRIYETCTKMSIIRALKELTK
jgi:hypothetical protein